MAAIYLDNDVSSGFEPHLRARRHDVLHTRAIGQAKATDDEQLLTAALQGRILVTHNEQDYLLVHRAWRRWPAALGIVEWPPHPGISVIPQPPQLPVEVAVDQTDCLIRSGRKLANELYILEPSGRWRRQR